MAEKEYIEREALIAHLKKSGAICGFGKYLIGNYPAADVAPVKHGKNETRMNPVDEFICSECGFTSREMSRYDAEEDAYYEFEPNFCPNCGADMRGEHNDP